MRSNSEIAYTEDVIKRVAEELNISENEVKKVYQGVVSYIQHIAKNTKHVAIKIPRLGYIYANEVMIRRELKSLEVKKHKGFLKDGEESKLQALRKKYANLQSYKKTIHKVRKKKKNVSYHFRTPTTKSPFFTNEMTFEEIEDFQKELSKKN